MLLLEILSFWLPGSGQGHVTEASLHPSLSQLLAECPQVTD